MEKSSGNSDSHDFTTLGCGTDLVIPAITLNINTTTGGNFSIVVENTNTVEALKKIIAKKLKVSKDRICLLHREKELVDGTLKDNGLMDGSKVILIPNVETGLLAQRPENTVMQALESLNDTQVNDFLSGKSPLNLSMRLGDHMMLIQLQLSTLNPSGSTSSSVSASGSNTNQLSSSSSSSSSSSGGISKTKLSSCKTKRTEITSSPTTIKTSIPIELYHSRKAHRNIEIENNTRLTSSTTLSSSPDRHHHHHHNTVTPLIVPSTTTITPVPTSPTKEFNTLLSKHDFENLQNIVKSLKENQLKREERATSTSSSNIEQSPIKSLSNLVSNSIKTAEIIASSPSTSSTVCTHTTDPISAKLTSCLCKSLDTNSNGCETNCQAQQRYHEYPSASPGPSTISHSVIMPSSPTRISSLHRTANNPINKHKMKHNNHALLRKAINSIENEVKHATEIEQDSEQVPVEATTTNLLSSASTLTSLPSTLSTTPTKSSTNSTPTTPTEVENALNAGSTTVIDTRALAEASRNLTQTLRKLSKEVFTNKIDVTEDNSRRMGTGAVIESMKHHGKGIYSGTFSGTLNPALQDRYGRPKRDISTIIHILNDLLSAAPQYRRSAKIKFEHPSFSSASTSSAGSSNSSSSSSGNHSKNVSGKDASSSSKRHSHHHNNQENECTTCSSSPRNSTATSKVADTSLNISNHCSYGECKGHTNENCSSHKSSNSNSSSNSKTNSQIVYPTCLCQQNIQDENSMDESYDDSALNLPPCRCSTNKNLSTISLGATASSSSASIAAPTSYCIKCNSTEIENNKTKCKLDHLRLIMQQKKQRREARKMKTLPYNSQARLVGTTTATATALTQLNTTANDVQQQPTHIVEEVDSVA